MKDILASKWLSDIEESNAVRFLYIPKFKKLTYKAASWDEIKFKQIYKIIYEYM